MSISLFGSSYDSVGTSNANLVLKTKGKVKVQWGSKYIDLIKDGKINVDSKFIFKESSVGTKDGIYVVGDGDDQKVVLYIGGTQIDLKGEVGTTYVSFMGEQEVTPDQKYTALQNIGFIYKDLETAELAGLTAGVIYIEAEQKFYIVTSSGLQEFSLSIPNPFEEQFVIAKTDEKSGALVIKGSGDENSLKFDTLSIYSKDGEGIINSTGDFIIQISGDQKVKITSNKVVFTNPVNSSTFQSTGATDSTGFRLYVNGSESTLEVDNLIVRKNIDYDYTDTGNLYGATYPEVWYNDTKVYNIISEITEDTNNTVDPSPPGYDPNVLYSYCSIFLKYPIEYAGADLLYVYAPVELLNVDDTETSNEDIDEDLETRLVLFPFKVINPYSDYINATLQIDLMDSEIFDRLPDAEGGLNDCLKNKPIFLVGRSHLKEDITKPSQANIIRHGGNNIDLITSSSFDDLSDKTKIDTRIGSINELSLEINNNGDSERFPYDFGIYSKGAIFKNAYYTSDYNLPLTDNTSSFASTEWVNELIKKLIPKGTIIMFNGLSSEIPDGWHICDGTDGTPDLINKFIKAGQYSGNTGGSSEIQLTEDNIPAHTHIFTSTIETSEAGDHYHTFQGTYGKFEGTGEENVLEVGQDTDSIATNTTGTHKHSIDLSGVSLSTYGKGNPIQYEPLYYTLIYIMKMN